MASNFNINGNINTPTPISCVIENGQIFQMGYNGTQLIGVTNAVHNEVIDMATGFKDKLVEHGIIQKERTPEELQMETQQMMTSMLEVINDLKNEVKELKEDGIKSTKLTSTDSDGIEIDGKRPNTNKPSPKNSTAISK